MTGPPLRIHIDPEAVPHAVHTPRAVPRHWEEPAKETIDTDVSLGVLGKVPFGVPTPWCQRMVLSEKADGGLRRTVDYSPLNKFCMRETHHVSLFNQNHTLTPRSWNTKWDLAQNTKTHISINCLFCRLFPMSWN
jgi:hypothetical protein